MVQGCIERKEGLAIDEPAESTSTVLAAGGLVSRSSDQNGLEVLVVHRPRYDDWSFPKGKLDPGETELQAAVREVQEETGLLCEPGRELAGAAYLDRRGRPKTVRYWHMTPVSGTFTPNDEVDAASWLGPGEALSMLTYRHDQAMLEELVKHGVRRMDALLIRHATAGKRGRWEGDDRLRPLDSRGKRQAQALADSLGDLPIRRLYSSPYLRCVQTLQPLAARLGIEVEEVAQLAEGAPAGGVDELVCGSHGRLVALCTHGDVIGEVVGLDAPNKKGSHWLLEAGDAGLNAWRYIPPPAQ